MFKYDYEDWIALHGGVDDGFGDIFDHLIEYRFLPDEKDYEKMFNFRDRDERAAGQEIDRLRKLCGPRRV